MTMRLDEQFRSDLRRIREALFTVSPELAELPWREGGWTRKQIMGHLLDSATNNRQRFVRASVAGSYEGPQYGQEEWVAAHGYASQSWDTLLRWWDVEHEILAAVVDRVPEDRLEAICVVGGESPVTLRFLIEDYIEHQLWHLKQLTAGAEPA